MRLDDEDMETRNLTSDERLLGAVIKQAITDGCERAYYFTRTTDSKTKKRHKIFTWNYERENARQWFSDNSSTLQHFCSGLGLSVEYVRKLATQLFDEHDEQHKPR